MAAALVFLVGQLFLYGITSASAPPDSAPPDSAPPDSAPPAPPAATSAQCTVPCSDCKEFANGNYTGTWSLKEENDPRCPGSCLYQRDSSVEEMCFCDPGPIKYEPTCCVDITVQIENELYVEANGQIKFDPPSKCPPISYLLLPGSTESVSFPCGCYITEVKAALTDGNGQCTPFVSIPGTQTGPFTIQPTYVSSPPCEVTKP